MNDDRDFSWLTRGRSSAPPEAARTEQILWVVRKDTRTATARIRRHPHGNELAVLVGPDLLWSEVFRPGDGRDLGAVATQHLAGWQAKGWQIVPPPSTAGADVS